MTKRKNKQLNLPGVVRSGTGDPVATAGNHVAHCLAQLGAAEAVVEQAKDDLEKARAAFAALPRPGDQP